MLCAPLCWVFLSLLLQMTFRRWTPDVFPTRCSHNIVQHVGKGHTPYSLSSLLHYHWFLKNGSIPSTITCAPPSWCKCCSLSEINPVFRAAGFIFQAATIFFSLSQLEVIFPSASNMKATFRLINRGERLLCSAYTVGATQSRTSSRQNSWFVLTVFSTI